MAHMTSFISDRAYKKRYTRVTRITGRKDGRRRIKQEAVLLVVVGALGRTSTRQLMLYEARGGGVADARLP